MTSDLATTTSVTRVISASPISGGKVGIWRHKIDQVMRNALALFERHLRSRNLDLFVNLDRIAIDDLAVEFQGNFNPERTFPRGSRTDNGDDRVFSPGCAHARTSITIQMSASSTRPPMIWLREKLIHLGGEDVAEFQS